MIGLVFVLAIAALFIVSIPLSVAARRNGGTGDGAIALGILLFYVPLMVAVVALPASLAGRCLTALYSIADISWSATGFLLFGLFVFIAVWRQLGILATRNW
ncbi:hypothetical protein HYZ76_00535 [Candidatus Falkowbacteria bacterium]|nr:hypothetical protein [Candidatus Falkowbacteria bacterium]